MTTALEIDDLSVELDRVREMHEDATQAGLTLYAASLDERAAWIEGRLQELQQLNPNWCIGCSPENCCGCPE